jgi:hypothetical protein
MPEPEGKRERLRTKKTAAADLLRPITPHCYFRRKDEWQ